MAKIMTKAEESNVVDRIEELINSTEANSYTRMAFAGCVKLARENIEYDFGNSFPDMIDHLNEEIIDYRKEVVALRERNAELDGKLKRMTESYEDMCKVAENNGRDSAEWEQQAHDVSTMYCKKEKECDEKDAEIMRLKAELYDYMRKELGK